ncbi:hypothetical protein EV356DRAFT_309877 [Viridothelium virens]|uniref:Uncharacterized protein n=1 Tax=Viridothelium virens TaxID=1048519 RepID=A0A6A6HKA5_VIRVR|nr:hypothetical protein EV356DRAFT_309877 [Viridothelium virens]
MATAVILTLRGPLCSQILPQIPNSESPALPFRRHGATAGSGVVAKASPLVRISPQKMLSLSSLSSSS